MFFFQYFYVIMVKMGSNQPTLQQYHHATVLHATPAVRCKHQGGEVRLILGKFPAVARCWAMGVLKYILGNNLMMRDNLNWVLYNMVFNLLLEHDFVLRSFKYINFTNPLFWKKCRLQVQKGGRKKVCRNSMLFFLKIFVFVCIFTYFN